MPDIPKMRKIGDNLLQNTLRLLSELKQSSHCRTNRANIRSISLAVKRNYFHGRKNSKAAKFQI